VLELVLSIRITQRSSLEAAGGVVGSPSRPPFSFIDSDGQSVSVYRPALFGAIFRFGVTIDGW
jgi:hypothetical protein